MHLRRAVGVLGRHAGRRAALLLLLLQDMRRRRRAVAEHSRRRRAVVQRVRWAAHEAWWWRTLVGVVAEEVWRRAHRWTKPWWAVLPWRRTVEEPGRRLLGRGLASVAWSIVTGTSR